MSHFEFLMGIVGFVGAISISSVIVFWGSVARLRSEFSNPWLLLCITVCLVLNLIIHIGGIWGYRGVSFDVYYKIVILLLPVVLGTLAVSSFIPQLDTSVERNLSEVYFRGSQTGYIFLALFMAAAQLVDLLPGVKALDTPIWAPLVVAVVALPSFFRNLWLHVAVIIYYVLVLLLPLLLAPIL